MNTKNEATARAVLEKILKNAPDVFTAKTALKLFPIGRNHLYEDLRSGELKSFDFRGRYIISKDDFAEYLIAHSGMRSRRINNLVRRKGGSDDNA